jgi:hypothetical protein
MSNVVKQHQVDTDGLRNETSLAEEQKDQVLSYAKTLGMPEEAIVFSDNMNTSYTPLFGEERLYIGTDVLPTAINKGAANSRINLLGAIAHELIGHRRAALAAKTQKNEILEEAQASIRAARFAPQLTRTERITLIRDAIERLHKVNLSIRQVKEQLWINEP